MEIKRRVVYVSLPGGHETKSAEAYHSLERMLRTAKPWRTRPRHFALPGDFAGNPRTLQPGKACPTSCAMVAPSPARPAAMPSDEPLPPTRPLGTPRGKSAKWRSELRLATRSR